MSDLTFRLAIALLRHFLRGTLGDEALDLVVEKLASIGGEELRARVDLLHHSGTDIVVRLLTAAQETESCFHRECTDATLRTALDALPLAGTESLQSALARLPESFDETSLMTVITDLFASAWPNLDAIRRDQAVKAYVSCLRRALLRIDSYSKRIIEWAVLRVDERTERIELEQDRINERLRNIEGRISEIIRNRLGTIPDVVETAALEDEPPLPPELLAPRTELVQQISRRISGAVWLSLTGATGLGKTQLARLVNDNYKLGKSIWIAIPRDERQSAIVHVRRQLIRLIDFNPEHDEHREIYESNAISDAEIHGLAARALGQSALVIVDDLPTFDAKDPLFSYLGSFANALGEYASTLITTGQISLPPLVSESLSDRFAEIAVPPFGQTDVESLLEALGAPEHINNEKTIILILASTSGHPALVSATINWLQSIQWKLQDIEAFSQLLSGDPARGIREEIARVLPRLVPHDLTREFLYRLSLLAHPFDERIAQVVANTEPIIRLPGEKLTELHGPWLSRTVKGVYEVSPLLRGSGIYNLSEELIENIHAAVVSELLSRSPIHIDQVLNIVIHLFASKQGDRLAAFLVQAMLQITTDAQADYLFWTTDLFLADAPQQLDIRPSMMVVVRALQIRILIMRKRQFVDLLTDLEQRIQSLDMNNEEDAYAAVFAYAQTGPLLDNAPTALGVAQAIRFSRLVRAKPELLESGSFPLQPQELIWFPLLRAAGIKESQAALGLIETLGVEEIEGLLSASLGDETVYVWVDRVWISESRGSADKAEWDVVLKILNRIEQIGTHANQMALIVAARRAQAIVHADYLKQPDKALQLLRATPQPETSSQVFMLHYTAASTLLDNSHLEEAIKEFDAALSAQTEDFFPYYRFDALRRSAEIYGRLDNWKDSLTWCRDAIRFALQHEIIPAEDRIELLAELAWIRWSENKRKQALGAMYAAVIQLAQIYSASDARQREVMLKTGHVLAWMTYFSFTGSALELTIDNQPYVPPFPGLVARRRENISQLTRPVPLAFLVWQVGKFALSVGAKRMALEALSLAHQYAKSHGLTLLSAVIDLFRSNLATLYLSPAEALSIGLSGTKSMAIDSAARPTAEDLMTSQIDVQQAWLNLPVETRRSAERQLFYTSFGYAVSYLLENDIPIEKSLKKIAEWRDCLNSQALEEKDYWMGLVGAAEWIFIPTTGWQIITEKIREAGSEDVELRILLYLALSAQLDTPLNDVANAQAVSYEFVLNPKSNASNFRAGVGSLIIRTWQFILEKRGFYLNKPMRLREVLGEVHVPPTEAEAARVLLTAAESVGVKYPSEFESALSKLLTN